MDSRLRGNDGKVEEMEKKFWVYIVSNMKNGTIYIGVTSDLNRRVYEHKEKQVEGFTKEYGLGNLVWYEEHPTAESAITKEKQMKKWNRGWKIKRIVEENPDWNDLYETLNR